MSTDQQPSADQLSIIIPKKEESLKELQQRIEKGKGQQMVILPDTPHDTEHSVQMTVFLQGLEKYRNRITIASRNKNVIRAARQRSFHVIKSAREMKSALASHPDVQKALLSFSSRALQKELRSRLQSMGLLTLPTARIWIVSTVSVLVFLFIAFELLPSATILITPRGIPITHTTNIYLTTPSAHSLPEHAKTMPLLTLQSTIHKTMSFDRITTKFAGENASVVMKVFNETSETVGLQSQSQLVNPAGMVFRTQESLTIPAGGSVSVDAVAVEYDLYGQPIGDRGNVPAGGQWTFLLLPDDLQQQIFAVNQTEGTGGTTAFTHLLTQEDLDMATRQLQQELLTAAKQDIEEQAELYASQHPDVRLEVLNKHKRYEEELTFASYENIVLPEQFIGQDIESVPVSGSITYTVLAFDMNAILSHLQTELINHVDTGKKLVSDSIRSQTLQYFIIEWNDELSWIKLTVEVSGIQEFLLDPFSVPGAEFGKRLRDTIQGKNRSESLNIVENLPEVEQASISIWPPWNSTLPSIPAHIKVEIAP